MDINWHTTVYLGISGEKVEIDPVTNQKASIKFLIRQKPISIDSDHLCACDLVEERSPSKWTKDTVAYFPHLYMIFTVENYFFLFFSFLVHV